MRKSKRIINLIAKAAIALALILIAAMLAPTIIFFIAMIFLSEKSPPVPADAEMIEHFKSHEELFEELRSMTQSENHLNSFPLSIHDKEEGKILPISKERELEYDSLMKKIQIKSFWEKYLFVYFEKGDATWGVEKGFEYVPSRIYEEKKEYTENELYDFAKEKLENRELYKKINDNWNLYLLYDR